MAARTAMRGMRGVLRGRGQLSRQEVAGCATIRLCGCPFLSVASVGRRWQISDVCDVSKSDTGTTLDELVLSFFQRVPPSASTPTSHHGAKVSAGVHLHEPLSARIWSDGRACTSRVSGVACAPIFPGSHPKRGSTIARHPWTRNLASYVCAHPHQASRCVPTLRIEARHGTLIDEILLRHRWRRCNGRLLGCCWRSVKPGVRMTA